MSAITGTMSSSGVRVTGSGTAFTTQIKEGDYISVASKGFRKVVNIISDTELKVDTPFISALSSSSGTYHRNIGFENLLQGDWVNDGTSDIWMWVMRSGRTFYMNSPDLDAGWLVDPASTIVPIAT